MAERSLLRRILRWAAWTAAAVVATGALFVAFVAFPLPMFPHHRSYEGFSVYSDREIGPEVDVAVAEAARRGAATELYRPGVTYRVYLAHSPRRYAFFCAVSRRNPESQALVFTRLGSMIVSAQGVEALRRRSGGTPPHSRLEGTLAGALAHEVAHVQVAVALGPRGARELPYWKSEGWADRAANLVAARDDPRYDLADRARLLLDDAVWQPPRTGSDRQHLRWQVDVEYLATVRGLSFAEIVDDKASEETTWNEVLGWLATASDSADRRTGRGDRR